MKRIITRTEAAEYLGISRGLFLKMQIMGVLPQPIPGTKKYDRLAIEATLSKASGLDTIADQPTVSYEDTNASYERWKAEQGIA